MMRTLAFLARRQLNSQNDLKPFGSLIKQFTSGTVLASNTKMNAYCKPKIPFSFLVIFRSVGIWCKLDFVKTHTPFSLDQGQALPPCYFCIP